MAKTKKTGDNFNAKLALTMKSGRSTLGYSSGIKALRNGKAKLIVLASNTPPLKKSEIEYYSMLAKTPVHHFSAGNVALGTACGKLFRVSCVTILDQGDSDIVTAFGGKSS